METVTTLDDDFIKSAIVEKFSGETGRRIAPEMVKLETRQTTVGHHMNEAIVHVVQIRIEE